MDRPISSLALTPSGAGHVSRASVVALAVIVLALLATALLGLPHLAPPGLEVGLDPAGAFAPPF